MKTARLLPLAMVMVALIGSSVVRAAAIITCARFGCSSAVGTFKDTTDVRTLLQPS